MKTRRITLFFAAFSLAVLYHSCQSSEQMNYEWYYANGKQLYEQHCQNCHNTDGTGLGALIPPLTDSVFMKKNRELLPCIIRNGLSGTITVHNKSYDGQMPANPTLPDIDVAAILTYITNSFGNNQGRYEVTADLKCAELAER